MGCGFPSRHIGHEIGLAQKKSRAAHTSQAIVSSGDIVWGNADQLCEANKNLFARLWIAKVTLGIILLLATYNQSYLVCTHYSFPL